MKRAHGMAQLNFPTIRLLHEIYDKMQHKQDKKNHNNATMNCNDHGLNYQQSTMSEDDTNHKGNDNDSRKHKHRINAKSTA